MAETLTLDPATAPLELALGTDGFLLRSITSPSPPRKRVEASSIDTEGSLPVESQYDNRTVTVVVRAMPELTRAQWYAKLDKLQMKVAKINSEGGVLKRVLIGGTTTIYYDLVDGQGDMDWDDVRYALRMDSDITLTFDALPFVRGDEILTPTDHIEQTLPCLIFTETGIKGDVSATARIVIDEDQANADQWAVIWGLQSRYYDPNPNAALFYSAASRTPLSGSALAAANAGGSGAQVIRSPVLLTKLAAIMSTQAAAAAQLQHVGQFDVWARVYASGYAGDAVSLALGWSVGDFTYHQQNDMASVPVIGAYCLVNLGKVRLPTSKTGPQQWQGRILAKSNSMGDTVDIDCLFIIPVGEGSGIIKGVMQSTAPAVAPSAFDDFNSGTVGNLNGKIASGSTWVTSGMAGDFQIPAGWPSYITRSTPGDGSARLAVLGPSLTDSMVQVDFTTDIIAPYTGVIARYVDATHFLAAYILPQLNSVQIAAAGSPMPASTVPIPAPTPGQWYTLGLQVSAGGRWNVYYGQQGTKLPLVGSGQHSSLATGGVLATGKGGITDINWDLRVIVREYAHFQVWVPPPADAAIYSGRSLQVRSDGNIRQDSTGTFWVPSSSYEGDMIRVPPAGMENRTARFIIKATRNDPDTSTDPNIDDISARLYYTPRWLQAPNS